MSAYRELDEVTRLKNKIAEDYHHTVRLQDKLSLLEREKRLLWAPYKRIARVLAPVWGAMWPISLLALLLFIIIYASEEIDENGYNRGVRTGVSKGAALVCATPEELAAGMSLPEEQP